MKFNWKLPFPFKRNHLFILKLVLPILLLGIAFRFLFISSNDMPTILETPLTEKTAAPTILEIPSTKKSDIPGILGTPLSEKTEDLRTKVPQEAPKNEDPKPLEGDEQCSFMLLLLLNF